MQAPQARSMGEVGTHRKMTVLIILATSALAVTAPAPAPSLAAGSQVSTCDQFLDIRPNPEADLPEQRDALMKFWTAVRPQTLTHKIVLILAWACPTLLAMTNSCNTICKACCFRSH